MDVKPSFPYSLRVFGNILVLKQQFINLKNLIFSKKNNGYQENISNQMMKNREFQKKPETNSHFLDNSNETDSLTIDEIFDTLVESEQKEKKLRQDEYEMGE